MLTPIEEGTQILMKTMPSDRGEAFKILAGQQMLTDGKTFDATLENYEKAKKRILPNTKRAIKAEIKKEAIMEAHKMSAKDIKKTISKIARGEATSQDLKKAWGSLELWHDGKHNDENLNEDFEILLGHGKKLSPQDKEKIIEDGLDILIRKGGEIQHRTHAWEILRENKKHNKNMKYAININSIFKKIVSTYEEQIAENLPEQSSERDYKSIARRAHRMSFEEIKKYGDSAKYPDKLLWKVYQIGQEGKFGKGNPIKQLPIYQSYFNHEERIMQGKQITSDQIKKQERKPMSISM